MNTRRSSKLDYPPTNKIVDQYIQSGLTKECFICHLIFQDGEPYLKHMRAHRKSRVNIRQAAQEIVTSNTWKDQIENRKENSISPCLPDMIQSTVTMKQCVMPGCTIVCSTEEEYAQHILSHRPKRKRTKIVSTFLPDDAEQRIQGMLKRCIQRSRSNEESQRLQQQMMQQLIEAYRRQRESISRSTSPVDTNHVHIAPSNGNEAKRRRLEEILNNNIKARLESEEKQNKSMDEVSCDVQINNENIIPDSSSEKFSRRKRRYVERASSINQ